MYSELINSGKDLKKKIIRNKKRTNQSKTQTKNQKYFRVDIIMETHGSK